MRAHRARRALRRRQRQMARIYGDMHFRYSTMAGATLGEQAANWTMTHHFGKRD